MDERQVEQLVSQAASSVEPPEDDELRAMGRQAGESARLVPRRHSPRRRWVAAVGVALLIGAFVGFGAGTLGTPEGDAGTKVMGLGFLPAQGWTVMQSETAGPTTARAIAATVPIHGDDAPGQIPRATVATLAPTGMVVVATFTPRGDPATDAAFPTRSLPLRFKDAVKTTAIENPLPRRGSSYRMRAGVGAYNVEGWIYFGSSPSAGRIAGAQRQLNRLVVASAKVTIGSFDRVLRKNQPYVTLFGSVDSGKENESVTIEGRECGPHSPSFRLWGPKVATRAGGGWDTPAFIQTSTVFRARWAGSVSAVVSIRARATVFLHPGVSPNQFETVVGGIANFVGKRVDIQRFNASVGTWTKVRSVKLTEERGIFSAAVFTMKVPPKSQLRAVFPLTQARPCYLAGYSSQLRT